MSQICLHCGTAAGREATTCPSCTGPLVPVRSGDDDTFSGRLLGDKYVLLERLGRGGFGAVYKAQDRTLDRAVAVKILHLDTAANPVALQRFYAEARNTSQLAHPNNVKIHDFGHTDDGVLYIVMELIDGEPLARMSMPFDVDRTVDIASQIAAALGEAHDRGLVHRDMKPENVMISQVDGRDFVRVLDYGISKYEDSDTGLTGTGAFIGTPAYTSPEQIDGGPIDRRVDIYALG